MPLWCCSLRKAERDRQAPSFHGSAGRSYVLGAQQSRIHGITGRSAYKWSSVLIEAVDVRCLRVCGSHRAIADVPFDLVSDTQTKNIECVPTGYASVGAPHRGSPC